MQPAAARLSYPALMATPIKTFLPYRVQFLQLSDGSWMAEDWRVAGLSAYGRTREECRDKLRCLIVDDAVEAVGDQAAALSFALSEFPKSDGWVEYLVTGQPKRPISKTTNA